MRKKRERANKTDFIQAENAWNLKEYNNSEAKLVMPYNQNKAAHFQAFLPRNCFPDRLSCFFFAWRERATFALFAARGMAFLCSFCRLLRPPVCNPVPWIRLYQYQNTSETSGKSCVYGCNARIMISCNKRRYWVGLRTPKIHWNHETGCIPTESSFVQFKLHMTTSFSHNWSSTKKILFLGNN